MYSQALIEIRNRSYQVVGRPVIKIELNDDPAFDNFHDLQEQLDALPSGTGPDDIVRVELPEGEFQIRGSVSDTVGNQINNQQFLQITGPGSASCTLYWPDYGPQYNGLWQRRHLTVSGCHNVSLGGFSVRGPHTTRSLSNPLRATYWSDHAFQHAVNVSSSTHIGLSDIVAYEIAGDGLYLNNVDDLTVTDMRVEFNGRQGVAGIQGNRWRFVRLKVVNSARAAIDWEPIGEYTPGVVRWVDNSTFEDCSLNGSFGVILHRCSAQTFDGGSVSGIRMSGSDDLLRSRRTLTVNNVAGPEGYRSTTKDWPIILAKAFKELTVTGCTADRDPTDAHTRNAPLVMVTDASLNGATITVRDNHTSNFVTALSTRTNLSELDTMVPLNVWDVGNNDLGGGVIEGVPEWIGSRL